MWPLCQIFPMSAQQRCLLNVICITWLVTSIWNCWSWIEVINLLLLLMFAAILMAQSSRGFVQRRMSLIFRAISHLFLEWENRYSVIFINDSFIYPPSVNGFPLFTICWAATKLAAVVDCGGLIHLWKGCCSLQFLISLLKNTFKMHFCCSIISRHVSSTQVSQHRWGEGKWRRPRWIKLYFLPRRFYLGLVVMVIAGFTHSKAASR